MDRRWIVLWAGMLALSLCACRNQTADRIESVPSPQPSGTPVLELSPEDWEAEYASCTVSGEETDYEVIAQQLTEQYAEALRARPQNVRGSVLDAQPDPLPEKRVYDAYYGEEDPNFCFTLSLYLDLAEEREMDWMVGCEPSSPEEGTPFPTYWGWSREASAEKGTDGDWHLMGTATGGAFARLPVVFGHPGDHPAVEEIMAAWFLTEGETHDWRIPLFLDTEGYCVEAVKAEILKCPEEEQSTWLEDIDAYMVEYGGSYTWESENWA